MNPYLVLGVPLNSDDQTIRRAYVDSIKLAPPDVDPIRFQAVNTAYESIKTEAHRHRHTLFDVTPPGDSPLDAFVRYVQLRRPPQPLSFETMKELLRACTKN